jgi:hypothetical protein
VDLAGATLPARWLRRLLTGALHDGTGAPTVIDPRGVRLTSGTLQGVLDLENVGLDHPLDLQNVNFTHEPVFDGADIHDLNFAGSRLPGLSAAFLAVHRNLWLNGATVTGTLDIDTAKIGGQFSANNATFDAAGQPDAISAQGATIDDGMFLTGATVTGTLDINSANIGGQFSATNATFDAAGQPDAISAQGATIAGLYLRDVGRISGEVGLGNAKVGVLVDSPAAWGLTPGVHTERPSWELQGLTYGRLEESAWPREIRKQVESRIDWLDANVTASPSIYQELAGEYRRVGHAAAARRVLIAGNDRVNQPEPTDSWRRRLGKWLRRWGFGRTVGYGYQPGRAVIGLFVLAAVVGVVVWTHQDVMVATYQNKPVKGSQPCATGAPCLQPSVYALDVVLPVIGFGQQKDWKPDASAGGWGLALKWLVYFAIAAGWVFATLVVAAFSGVLKRV